MTNFGAYSRYYDLIYGSKDYIREADFVLAIAARRANPAMTLLDLGCGTGIHACAFARAGFQVTAVDRSEFMLARARERASEELHPDCPGSVEFVLGDVRNLSIGRQFDVVTSLFHVISYLSTNADLRSAFSRIRSHLQPWGVLIFDHWYGPAVLTERPTQRVRVFEDAELKVVRVANPTLRPNDNLVDVYYELFVIEKATGRCEQFSESHLMRYLFRPELQLFLALGDLELVEFTEGFSERLPSLSSWSTVAVATVRPAAR